MKHTNFIAKTFASTVLTVLSFSAFAGPGTLTNSPLIVNSVAKPNIMFLTDTSGSMRHIVPEDSLGADPDKYDSTTTYINGCGAAEDPNSREDAGTDSSLYIRIVGNQPQIYNSSTGNIRTLGTGASNICFSSTETYNASLYADNGSGTAPAGSATAIYSGNYLNWYLDFDNTTTNWNTGQTLKPGTDYRMNIARTTLKGITDSLDDTVRVGLATFNSSSGAEINFEVADLTAANKTLVIAEIDTFVHSGVTPMAEALHQVGRYFLGDSGTTSATAPYNGQYSGNLTLHPDAVLPATPEIQAKTAVFPTNYRNTSGGTGGLESPIEYWCQNNFVVFMSDGVSRSDTNIPTVTRTGPSSAYVYTPSILADYDGDCPAGGTCDRSNDQKPTASGYIYDRINDGSDYLDDVAQALFEIDLRPDINADPVAPATVGDPVVNNIVTYTIAFADLDALNNKLLDDAATQAGGKYFTSANGAELIQDFNTATNSILARTSSASAATFNTSTLGNDTAVFKAEFSTSFWSGDIFSNPVDPLNADIIPTGSPGCTLNTDPGCWNASKHLDDLAFSAPNPLIPYLGTFEDNRQIITFDSTNQKGIPFTTPVDFTAPATNEITTAMISDLCAGPDAPLVSSTACTSATTGAKDDSQQYVDRMVDYIRGDRTFENIVTTPVFRTRLTVLGDIVNATPVFVGAPELPWPTIDDSTNKFGEGYPDLPVGSGKRYSDFQAAQANRIGTLYASANDGMLHAIRTKLLAPGGIREKAGDELFAYIPSFIFSDQTNEGLHHLAEPTYPHKFYLDLSPIFSDVYIKGKDSTNAPTYETAEPAWRTILISGSRGGEKKGIFALDITDPALITESNAADTVLWEFTSSDDVDLGHTYSIPTVTLTNALDGTGKNRWAAIFGNGYQNDTTTVSNGSTCRAKLFIVFLDGGLDGTWTLGTNPSTADYMKIDTEVGTTAAGDCNGLSTPALADTDGDKVVDRVYAGDVKGNMWAFDLTCGGGGCAFDVDYKQGQIPQPLFTAYDSQATPVAQPIMAQPSLVRHTTVTTTTSNAPNIVVLFGTGQYHTNADNIGTTKINTYYGVWDNGTGNLTDNRQNDTSTGSTLVEQVLNTQQFVIPGTEVREFRFITANTIDWTDKYGWYINLDPENGVYAEERSVVSSAVRNDAIFFNTMIPSSVTCGYGGYGWLMAVDFITGGEPDGAVLDVNRDGVVDDNDNINGDVVVGERTLAIPASSTFIDDYQFTQTSDGSIIKRKVKDDSGLRAGRLSWRELRSPN